MTTPTLTALAPTTGPTGGGELVRLTGTGFAATIAVLFDGSRAQVLGVRAEGAVTIADVRTPPHAEGLVDVLLRNLDATGVPIPGEEGVLRGAYRYRRPAIVRESDLTRLVRTLLRELKRQLLENVSISVSVEYDDTTADGLNVVAMATLPSLVLSGPRVQQNRFFSTNEAREEVVAGPAGAEILRRRPPLTVDLGFTLTAASDRTAELLNLMAAVATFLNRNRWIAMPRDPSDAASEVVRWEMDLEGEFRTRLDGPGDLRAFTFGFVVRGFDLDEGWPLDLGRAVDETQLGSEAIPTGGTP